LTAARSKGWPAGKNPKESPVGATLSSEVSRRRSAIHAPETPEPALRSDGNGAFSPIRRVVRHHL
jgi:hypothetical protein